MQSTKLNLDDLYEYKKEQDLTTLKIYQQRLERVHKQIKIASRQKINHECSWYVVPEFLLGIPRYDVKSCVAYIIHELQENGFKIKYTHPNLLFISWGHWVPDYVREEYKKQTGVMIDGFGKEIKKEEKKPVLKPSYKSTGIYDDFIKLS